MSKREDISLQHIPAVGHTQEESFETKKLKIHPSSNLLGRILWYLGVWDIFKSLGSHILVQNWKSMWKSHILSIFYLRKFLGCLWFLGLCLVKNVHFWAILTKICFCPNHQHMWTKNKLKTILNWIWIKFCSFVLMIRAKTDFGQNCPKMDIFH